MLRLLQVLAAPGRGLNTQTDPPSSTAGQLQSQGSFSGTQRLNTAGDGDTAQSWLYREHRGALSLTSTQQQMRPECLFHSITTRGGLLEGEIAHR